MKRLWMSLNSVLVVLQYVVFVPLVLAAAPFVATLFALVALRGLVEQRVRIISASERCVDAPALLESA